jgi:hypothetical protein
MLIFYYYFDENGLQSKDQLIHIIYLYPILIDMNFGVQQSLYLFHLLL